MRLKQIINFNIIVHICVLRCKLKKQTLITLCQNYYLCAMNLVDKNIEAVKDLCKKHKVRKLFAFGSVLS